MYDDDTESVRTFTLQEARSLMPRLRKLLARVSKEREALLDMRVEIDLAREKASEGGGGSPFGPTYITHLIAFSEAIQEIEYVGVHVKDLRTGLVDFPYDRDGRIVYLCWKPDEDEIGWWHETDAGFAGRQMLTDEFE
ncbi:MAG TPA: DUF2203 domain-containing protein [Blastocatellia bacterium]|nr:DUF2203 domain-containing protein [Blastocatellia bacterium]